MIKNLLLFVFFVFAVAMAVPSSRAKLQQGVYQPIIDNINRRLVPGRLDVMADQLDIRLGRAEGFPGS